MCATLKIHDCSELQMKVSIINFVLRGKNLNIGINKNEHSFNWTFIEKPSI